MATVAGNFEGRIQLKHDTETNWKLVPNFTPLLGEIIIYEPEPEKGYSYSRIKIGDGRTIGQLPFIDSGTLNGKNVEIVKVANRTQFPTVGSSDKLYVDLQFNKLYHYTQANGYAELLNFEFSTTQTSVSNILGWSAGTITNAEISNHKLYINLGTTPNLSYEPRFVLSGITAGGDG